MSFDYIAHLANNSGGVLYVIIALLFVALTVIIERSWFLARTAGRTAKALDELDNGDTPGAATLAAWAARDRGLPTAHLFEVAGRHAGRGTQIDREALTANLEEVVMREAPRVDRFLWVLDTIVTLAPLLGLFGTIVGMFNAFQVLSNPGNAPTQVTGGVAEALVATASGLFVAMIGLVFFNGLQNRVRVIVHQLETLRASLSNRLSGDASVAQITREAPHLVNAIPQHGV
jgi:biopolymer transport protein ExbB